MRQESAKVKGKTEQSRAVWVGGGEEYDYVYATWQLLKVQVRPVCVCVSGLCVCVCTWSLRTYHLYEWPLPTTWPVMPPPTSSPSPCSHGTQVKLVEHIKINQVFLHFLWRVFFCLLTCLGARVCVYHTIWRPFKVSTLYCILLGARPS